MKNTQSLIARNKSLENRAKVSKALKGRVFSANTIEKMKESHLGQKAWNKGMKFDFKARKLGGTFRSSKEYQKNHLQYIRNSVLEALGGSCRFCGFSDKRALQIDHINGGGSKERKERTFKGTFHKHVLQSFLKKEDKYQLLCANCNWIKRVENKEIRQFVI